MVVEFPKKCKECEHYNHCKKKNYSKGSSKCREVLFGEKKEKQETVTAEQFTVNLLWFYYNQSKNK